MSGAALSLPRRLLFIIILGLSVPKCMIHTGCVGNQFIVRAKLDDSAFLKDRDLVAETA